MLETGNFVRKGGVEVLLELGRKLLDLVGHFS
jgi:hypothetical protein